MAEVWEARHAILGDRVAVKFLLPESANDEALRARFAHEGWFCRRLQHPNIVAVLDVISADERICLVMQYIDGQDLEIRLRSGSPLSLEEMRNISWDVLSALDYAHSLGVVHRDVTSANVLIDQNARTFLINFGKAVGLGEERSASRSNATIGTPEYMSPEQVISPDSVDPRSDIYSFGCVLYAMLTGHPPFGSDGDTAFHIQDCHVRQAPPPLVYLNPDVPSTVEQVVLRCLEKDPARRYQSCRAVMNALNAAISAESTAARRNTTMVGSPPPALPSPPPAAVSPRAHTEFGPTRTGVERRDRAPAPWGSAPQPDKRAGAPATGESRPDATLVEVFFATDRMRMPSLPGGVRFSGLRSINGTIHYGTCEISIPKVHKLGKLESPSILRLEFRPNPEKHIVLAKARNLDEREFFALVRSSVAMSAAKDTFVFIHGYNVSFEDAARRTGQIAFDLDFVGAPIMYSWPSNGKAEAYLKDETNVAWSAPHFQHFLELLSFHSGAERIHIIAHSMGNRAVCEALKTLSLNKPRQLRFSHLLLAAADIDADTFEELSAALQGLSGRVTLYESSRDKAIQASKKIHGNPRVGEPLFLVPGMDTIDASTVDTDFLGHSYFSDNWPLLSDIHAILFDDKPAAGRFGLTPMEHKDGVYYAFKR